MNAARSATPDAQMIGGADVDWVLPAMGALSAPSSATKGTGLRNRGPCPLSPTALSMRLSLTERAVCATPYSAPASRPSWGRSMDLTAGWTFWVDSWDKGAGPEGEAVQRLEEVGSFTTINNFWSLFNNLPLAKIPCGTSLHMFKGGIRPTWEDEHNANGGHLRVVVKEDSAAGRAWLDLTLALVGDQFESCDHLCGVGATKKDYGTALCLWLSSRDPALRDMVSNQLAQMVGAGAQPVFKPHKAPQSLEPPSSTTVKQQPSSGGASCLRDTVGAAKATQQRRRTNSAPSPAYRRRASLWDEEGEFTFGANSTLAGAGPGMGWSGLSMSGEFESTPMFRKDSSPVTASTAGASTEQSERALKAGVRCLNPSLVTEPVRAIASATVANVTTPHTGRAMPHSTTVSRMRSYSDSHRHLVVHRRPLSQPGSRRSSFSPMPAAETVSPARTPQQQRQALGRASEPLFQSTASAVPRADSGGFRGVGRDLELLLQQVSPTKTPLAWADAIPIPWGSGDPATDLGSPPQAWSGGQPMWARKQTNSPQALLFANASAQEEASLNSATLPVPPTMDPPAEGAPEGAEDPHHEWQVQQRGRDACGTCLQQPRRGPRGTAEAHGKSASPAFVHKGYLYPPGLNRKQRRAIVFNPDNQRDSPQGIWVGLEVPDGPVSDEELSKLQAGQTIDRTVPLGQDGAPEAPTSRGGGSDKVSPPMPPRSPPRPASPDSPGRSAVQQAQLKALLEQQQQQMRVTGGYPQTAPPPPPPPPAAGGHTGHQGQGQQLVRVVFVEPGSRAARRVHVGGGGGQRLVNTHVGLDPRSAQSQFVLAQDYNTPLNPDALSYNPQGMPDLEPPPLLNGMPTGDPYHAQHLGADAHLLLAQGLGQPRFANW